MRNNFLILHIIIFLVFISYLNLSKAEDFTFESTSIEINEEENLL